MTRSDSRLAVELTLPLGFTALLAATAMIVAAKESSAPAKRSVL